MAQEAKHVLLLPSNLAVFVFAHQPSMLVFKKISRNQYYKQPGSTDFHSGASFPAQFQSLNPHGVDDIQKFEDWVETEPEVQYLDLSSCIISVIFKDLSLFVLLERGVVISYEINVNCRESWYGDAKVLITHLKPPGWETMQGLIQFQTEANSSLTGSHSAESPSVKFDVTSLDLADNLDRALSLMSSLHDSDSDILIILIGMRIELDEKVQVDDSTSVPVYDSQLVLHKFSMKENVLVSSQIFATEIVPSSLFLTKNFLISLPREKFFSKFLLVQSLANLTPRCPNAFAWSPDQGKMCTWQKTEISVQIELSSILDVLGNVYQIADIKDLKCNSTSNNLILIDEENYLYYVDLNSTAKTGNIPFVKFAEIPRNWSSFDLHDSNKIVVIYKDCVLVMKYSVNSAKHEGCQNPFTLFYTVLPISNCVAPSMTCLSSHQHMRGLRMVRLILFSDSMRSENASIMALNCQVELKQENADKQTKTLTSEKVDDLRWITKRLGAELKHSEIRQQLENYVLNHEDMFQDLFSEESKLQPERTDNSNEVHTITLTERVKELIFGTNYNLAARFFHISQIEDEKPRALLDEIFKLIGYRTNDTESSDEGYEKQLTHSVKFSDAANGKRCSIQDMQKMFLPEEDEIFSGKMRSKLDAAVLPVFELVCRLIVNTSNEHEGRKFVRFLVDSINNHSDVSLFQKVSEDYMLKRFERVHLLEGKSSPKIQIPSIKREQFPGAEDTFSSFLENCSVRTVGDEWDVSDMTLGDLQRKFGIKQT